MILEKMTYNGKELLHTQLCGYRCFFHKDLVQTIKRSGYIYKVEFPLIGCDIIEVDGNLVVIPGKYKLFIFSYIKNSKIDKVDGAIKIFGLGKDGSTLILSEQDQENIKIKWSNGDDKFTTLLYKDGKQESIPSEELLKYL